MQQHLLTDKPMAQGELYILPVGNIPAEFKPVPKQTPTIVGHSETGHHHVIADGVTMFESEPVNPLVCYLQIADDLSAPVELKHLRSFQTHPSILLQPGSKHRVQRARENTPEGWRVARD